MDDILVAITTIKRFPVSRAAEAVGYALAARGEGKRSEILSETESHVRFPSPMQDLRPFIEQHGRVEAS